MLCILFGFVTIWAPSSEFVSSSIPSWHILTAHAQPFRGARDLAFCLKVPLDSLLLWASSEGSGETARMRRLAWTFAARIGDKYQIRLTRSIYCSCIELATYLSTSRRDSVGWCLMLSFFRAHQGSTGGILLLQRFGAGLAVDSSPLPHLRVDLDLYVFYDGALIRKKSCTQIG